MPSFLSNFGCVLRLGFLAVAIPESAIFFKLWVHQTLMHYAMAKINQTTKVNNLNLTFSLLDGGFQVLFQRARWTQSNIGKRVSYSKWNWCVRRKIAKLLKTDLIVYLFDKVKKNKNNI